MFDHAKVMPLTQLAPKKSDSEISPEVSSCIKRAFFGGEEVASEKVIHSAFLYHFETSGGGTRTKLTFNCATLLGVAHKDGCSLAACVECLHNASLIQDDLQDRSTSRRGKPTVAMKYGNDVALGLTNRLITSSFACLAQESMAPVLGALIRKLHHVVAETIDGQTVEMLGEKEHRTLEARLVSSSKKSGPLFSLALGLPLIMAGHEDASGLAHEAAMQFGLAYQIMDDLDDQKLDAASGSSGNLVLAIGAQSTDCKKPSTAQAIQIACDLFHNSAEKAKQLPHNSGSPLIELINYYIPLLGARSQ